MVCWIRRCLSLALVLTVAGCGASADLHPVSPADASGSSATAALFAGTVTTARAGADQYIATVALAPSAAPDGAMATLTITAQPGSRCAPLVSVSLRVNAPVTLSALPQVTLTVPASVANGGPFSALVALPDHAGQEAVDVSTSGATLRFGGAAAPLTLPAGATVTFTLYADAPTTPGCPASPTPTPTPTPAPTPTPTPTPTPSIVLNPTSLSFAGTGSGYAQVVAAHEAGFAGAFLVSLGTCAGIATVGSIGPSAFDVTPVAAGACALSVGDGVRSAQLPVIVTVLNVGGQ